MGYRLITYLRIMLTLALTHLCLASHKMDIGKLLDPEQTLNGASDQGLRG